MAKCNCAGSTCGCLVIGGTAVTVTGTGTAANPFVVTADLSRAQIANSIAVASSSTIELGKKGSGSAGDPVVLTAALTLRSPNNTRWTLAVADDGTVTAIAAGASPVGATTGGSTVVANEILYWDPTTSTWPARSTAAEVVWISLGSTNVPVPAGFHKNDTWLCEAT